MKQVGLLEMYGSVSRNADMRCCAGRVSLSVELHLSRQSELAYDGGFIVPCRADCDVNVDSLTWEPLKVILTVAFL
ncbi:putative transcriptional regulator [Salmonella phage 21]|nr:putative transcriptional regulator [Salmonella phage 21]